MKALAIDTSTNVLTIALQVDDLQYENTRAIGLKHSEILMPLVDNLFTEAQLDKKELELVICARGPGSFTGLRIGMATAKGIASGAGCPIVAIPTLDVYAFPFSFLPLPVMPVIDAKKNNFYTALYSQGKRTIDYCDIGPEEIKELIKNEETVFITGPDAYKLKDMKTEQTLIIDSLNTKGNGFDLLHLGKQKYAEYGPAESTEGPLYIRKSDAERLSGRQSK